LLLAAQERWEEAREVLERGADFGVGEDDADVEVNGESGELGLPSLGMRERDEEENDTVDSVQSDADVRTLLGPPISIRNPTSNGDSSTITPAIKKDGIGNISINRDPPITSTNPPQPIYIFSHSHSQSPSSSTTTSTTQSLPPTSTLLLTPPPSKYPPSQYDLFESHLQLRMTQGTVVEIVEGAEGAEALWLEVFGWVAKRRNAGDGLQRQSIDGTTQQSSDHISSSHHHTITTSIDGSHHLHPNPNPNPVAHHHNQQQTSYPTDNTEMYQTQTPATGSSDLETNVVIPMIPITISPATPTVVEEMASAFEFGKDREKEKEKEKEKDQRKDYGKEKRTLNNAFRPKRLTSIDIEGDNNNRLDVQKSKKNVGQMLKGSVMKSRAGITAATKKLGARHGGLRRSTSTPGSFWFTYFFRGNFRSHFWLPS
jgi:hypothetical protein